MANDNRRNDNRTKTPTSLWGFVAHHAKAVAASLFWELVPLIGYEVLMLGRKGVNNKFANLVIAIIIKVTHTDAVLRSNLPTKVVLAGIRMVVPVPSILEGKEDKFFDTVEEFVEESILQQDAFSRERSTEENLATANAIVAEALKNTKGGAKMTAAVLKTSAPAGKTIIEIVGGLKNGEAKKFNDIVERLTGLTATATPGTSILSTEGKEFLDKFMVATGTDAEIHAIIAAPSPKLQEELLKRLVARHRTGGGIESLWHKAQSLVEGAVPSHDSAGKFGEELDSYADQLEAEDDALSGVR
jgi:hypothetical protein